MWCQSNTREQGRYSSLTEGARFPQLRGYRPNEGNIECRWVVQLVQQ